MRAHSLSVGLALVCVASTCSTVDRGPIDECRDDIDCGTGSVCSLAQGNICVPEALPPQTALGFEIKENESLRIELLGCDPEVTLEPGGSELRVQKRSSLVRDFVLRTSEARTIADCDECTDTCDEAALTCTKPADTTLDLSMRSRLGLDALGAASSYVIPPEPQLPTDATFTWPTYDSTDDPTAQAAVVLQVTPPAETAPRSRYLRVLAPDAPVDIDSAALDRCERAIIGNEGSVRTFGGTPIAGATVQFIYDEVIATSATVIGTGAACVEDADCPPGWACNLQGTCGLDLRGVSAGSSISLADAPGALPPAYLYTYCEDDPGEELVREFSVRVEPPDESGLPDMVYELVQTFPDPPVPGILTEINLEGGALCLPDWQPPIPVGFSVQGDPITLAETELGTYTCCSTSCLPSTDPGVEPSPPPQVETCTDFGSASFETRWFNANPLEWAFAGCLATGVNSDASSGEYVRGVGGECVADGCSVPLTSGEIDELARNYTVSIVQGPDSVFRSKRYTVAVTAETETLEFQLEPRVLLRGSVTCVESECSTQGAEVWAERLRSDTDDSDPLSPFEYSVTVDALGNFVMPLDPGLYVFTAYPSVGQAGGPAPYQVVDLREGSTIVAELDGVPHAMLPDPLELDDGVLVRVQLRDFPVSTRVTPYDVGSWKYQDDFPEDLDLNAPGTCLGSSTCSTIRRLRPTDTPLSLLLSGQFQFTTRDRGGQCPQE